MTSKICDRALSDGNCLYDGTSYEKNSIRDIQNSKSSNDYREFLSGSGEVVRLQKRVKTEEQSRACYDLYEDETYGTNINELLDRIESDNSSKYSSSKTGDCKNYTEELWVEKWRPRKFIDLVGNEKTNRRVLRWLRQWSPAVFQESLPQPLYETGFDPLQRPAKRILLVHGPPGFGKTSMAHVVARQAGYTVAEINASDERGGPRVRDKILNTLFNHTFNQSPVCLIADEIDGTLESGFIRVLIDVVNSDFRATRKTGIPRKGKKNKERLLLRPIIALCNNLYSPALEKLRPLCEIVAFKRPSENSLNDRLDAICKMEGVKINSKNLKDLTDLSCGDVRSCINNLQFWATSSSIASGTVDKDVSSSWYSLVNSIFQKDPHKDFKRQLASLSECIEKNGNYDRIVQGCHSIFPQVKYSDNGVTKPSQLADWLYFHDLMNKSIYGQNGELRHYCAIVPLQFAHMFGDIANKADIRVKNFQYEFNELQKFTMDVINCISIQTLKRSPGIQSFTSRRSLISETLPYVDNIIATDVSKCKNLKTKQCIYDILADLLNFFQLNIVTKNHDSLETKKILSVEPPLHQVVLFDKDNKQQVSIKRSTALNFLLAKSEESKAKKRLISQTAEKKVADDETRSKRPKFSMAANTVDFFKMQYKVNDPAKFDTDGPTSRNRHNEVRIWVRYKEGFSNAVRKNVTWNSLWCNSS